ncbi:MAG: class I SAM-dependent methyltransferase [Bacteroidota bacterium]
MNKTQQAVSIFDKYANEYQNKFMDVSLYKNSFDIFLNLLPINSTLLEIACGPGNITKYLLSIRSDLKITGTDLAPNMLALAKQNNPIASFQLLDGRAILQLQKNYNAILCGFAFPYFSKEETIQFIKDAASVLNPNGVLYISTMEDNYNKSGFRKGSQGDEMFMHFHQADYLTEALIQNGFTLIETQRVESVSTDNSKTIDLILIAVKK